MTINEVSYNLNKIDFSDKLDINQLEKKQVKKSVKVFEDTNLSRLLHTLNILDDIEMSYVTNIDAIVYRAEKTQSLTCNVFCLVSFKQLVVTLTFSKKL